MRIGLWGLLLASCGGPDDKGGTDTTPADDTVVDTPTVDTPPVDTTDTVEDTPAVDTPEDTVVPLPEPPATLGAGFTNLTDALWATETLVFPAVDYTIRETPNDTWFAVGDIGDDGVMDLVLAGIARPETDQRYRTGVAYVWRDGALQYDQARNDDVQLWFGQITAIVDLDDDGDSDLVRATDFYTFQLAGPSGWTTVDLGVDPDRERTVGLTSGNAMDVDFDGWLDWVFTPNECQQARPQQVQAMLRSGLSSWTRHEELFETAPLGKGYAVLQAPLGAADPYVLFIGKSCHEAVGPAVFLQTSGRDAAGFPLYTFTDPTPADALYRLQPGSAGPDVNLSRAQPMGAAVTDFDLDGTLDVAFTLAAPQISLFGAGTPLVDWSWQAGVTNPMGYQNIEMKPWGVAPIDADQDGRPDLLAATGDDSAIWYDTGGHYPHVTELWWNTGDGRFVEFGGTAGVNAPGDWHAVSMFDLDHDADPDLAIGGFGTLPMVLQNNVDIGNHKLALTLHGTTSNHLGVGAIVRLEAPDLPAQTRLMGEIGSVDAGATPELFFGLGAATSADLVITWPSGVVQRVTGLAADQKHRVEEPALITLSEVDRHIPSDPSATLDVVVTPRDTDGALRAGQVEIDLAWGAATWAGPATVDGDVWTRTLVAPEAQGSAVIEVTVDGVVTPIHPRVWFDR